MSDSIFSVIFGHFNDSEWLHPDLVGKLEILAEYDVEEWYTLKKEGVLELQDWFWMEFESKNFLSRL